MDGVLIDSELLWKKNENNFFKKFVSDFSSEDNKEVTGKNIFGTYEYLSEKFKSEMSNISFLDFEKKIEKFGLENIYSKTKLLPNLKETLEILKNNFLLAITSSSPRTWVDKTLDLHNLKDYFKLIISSEDAKNAKPAPDLYLKTIEKLNLKSSDCLAVEDSDNGVVSASKAGVFTVGFRNGFNQDQKLDLADIIIKDLFFLKTFLKI